MDNVLNELVIRVTRIEDKLDRVLARLAEFHAEPAALPERRECEACGGALASDGDQWVCLSPVCSLGWHPPVEVAAAADAASTLPALRCAQCSISLGRLGRRGALCEGCANSPGMEVELA